MHTDDVGLPIIAAAGQSFFREDSDPTAPLGTRKIGFGMEWTTEPKGLEASKTAGLFVASVSFDIRTLPSPGPAGHLGDWSVGEVNDREDFYYRVYFTRGPIFVSVWTLSGKRWDFDAVTVPLRPEERSLVEQMIYTLDMRIEGYLLWGKRIDPGNLVSGTKQRPIAHRVNAGQSEVALDQALALLGGKVVKASAKEVQFTVGGRAVTVAFGTRTASVAGRQVKLPSPARHYDYGITVPLQLLAEATGQPVALKRTDGRQIAEARPARAPG